MTSSRHRSSINCLALGMAAALGLASAASADNLRLLVGDLTQPAAARDFEHRLDGAARRFCFARNPPGELDETAACLAAIREEGLAELSAEQHDALARSLGVSRQLASAVKQPQVGLSVEHR